MGVFKDTKNRTWDVKINIASIKRVRDQLGEDILNVETVLTRLIADPIFLVDAIYVICRPQADALGVSDENFGEAFSGEVLEEAKKVLIQGIGDFFQSPETREAFLTAVQRWNTLETAWARKKIQSIRNQNVEQIINQAWEDATSGKPSMNSLESSESTPTP